MPMYKKMILILLILLMVTVTSCTERRDAPPDERPEQSQQQPPSENMGREDKLAKSDEENVEENINGFDIEDDEQVGQDTEQRKEDKVSGISQQDKMNMLKKIEPKKINTILEEYDTTLPEEITQDLQYTEYDIAFDYFLITSEDGFEVRESPAPDSTVIAEVENLDKVSLLQRAEGETLEDSNIWYRVAFGNGDEVKEGYVHSSAGTPRMFRFENMRDGINQLNQQLSQGELHFIRNYKYQNGAPPKKGDAAVDEYGYRAYHSAPAYTQADTSSDFRYIPDGMLVRILNERDDFYHVNSPTFGEDYYVPKKYINRDERLSQLQHVIVVDRDQQNQAAFELGDDGLKLISYTLSTTGLPGEYSFETTLGSYKALDIKDRFQYLQKGSQEIAGYAPFAIRFTGGAYIHGVPVAYEEEDGEKVDPGTTEYLHTIGTFPRSSMCVRNFTSHAKFLYEWMDAANGAVIVIE